MAVLISAGTSDRRAIQVHWILELILVSPDGPDVNEVEKILLIVLSLTERGQQLSDDERQIAVAQRGWASPARDTTAEWFSGDLPWLCSLINQMDNKRITKTEQNSFSIKYGSRDKEQSDGVKSYLPEGRAEGPIVEPFYFFHVDDKKDFQPVFSTFYFCLEHAGPQLIEMRFRTDTGGIQESPSQRILYIQDPDESEGNARDHLSASDLDDRNGRLTACVQNRRTVNHDVVIISHPEGDYNATTLERTEDQLFTVDWPKVSAHSKAIATHFSVPFSPIRVSAAKYCITG